MNQESIFKWTRRNPFRPFRLRLTGGSTHEIRHPDMVLPTRHEVAVGVPPGRGGSDPSMIDELIFVSYFHIMEIEPLPQPTQPAAGTEGSERG